MSADDTFREDLKEIIRLLGHIAGRLDQIAEVKRPKQARKSGDERVALAVVAIAGGASSFTEIAKALGVSRGTVSRNPGIRRAMESAIRDRRPTHLESAKAARWNQ